MAERLPVDGSDASVWGPIILGWLLSEHDTAGAHSKFVFYEDEIVSYENEIVTNETYTN